MKARAGVWLVAAACAVALGGWCSGAEEKKGGATGTWKWEFMTNDQTLKFTLKAKQDGDKLTGVLKGPREGAETKIDNGKVKVDEVSFSVTRERNGNKF